jgi:hypothetical protein
MKTLRSKIKYLIEDDLEGFEEIQDADKNNLLDEIMQEIQEHFLDASK